MLFSLLWELARRTSQFMITKIIEGLSAITAYVGKQCFEKTITSSFRRLLLLAILCEIQLRSGIGVAASTGATKYKVKFVLLLIWP